MSKECRQNERPRDDSRCFQEKSGLKADSKFQGPKPEGKRLPECDDVEEHEEDAAEEEAESEDE